MGLRRYHSVGFNYVKLTGKFWSERLGTVLAKTIPSQYEKLVENNIVEALNVAHPPPPLTIPRNSHDFTTQIFWYSDIGKWIEAASYALAHGPDKKTERKIDAITEQLAKVQLPDGYLNCWYIGREINKRWLNLAAYFINERGKQPHYFDQEAVARGADPKHFWAKTCEYNQSHKPVREQTKIVLARCARLLHIHRHGRSCSRTRRQSPQEGLRSIVA